MDILLCCSFELSVDMLDYMDDILALQSAGELKTALPCTRFGIHSFKVFEIKSYCVQTSRSYNLQTKMAVTGRSEVALSFIDEDFKFMANVCFVMLWFTKSKGGFRGFKVITENVFA